MKKRILSMLLTMLLVFSFIPLVNAAEVEVDKTDAENAVAFVNAILGDVLVDYKLEQKDSWMSGATTYGAESKNVTRAQFVGVMAKLFKLEETVETKYIFSDVPPSHENASAIRQAVELGWVSKADAFRPTNNITYAEAMKIAVTAMGYEDVAKTQGGYTTGYFWVANKIGLLNRLSMEEDVELDNGELAILVENMLNAKIARVVGTGIMITYDTEMMLMEYYYDIYKVKGIVDATKHSSLTSVKEFSKDVISINGVAYNYNGYTDDYLGYNVLAYCRDNKEQGEKEILYIKPVNNEVYEYSSPEFSGWDNGKLHFEDVDSTFSDKLKVDNSYVLIYNGKKVTDKGNAYKYLDEANGFIRVIDNSQDGEIDVILVEDYKYIYVGEVNAEKLVIADENSPSNNVNLEDVYYVMYDNATGNEIGFENIKIGSVVAVAMSRDSKIAKLLLCDEVLTDKPEGFGSDGVVFDGTEYAESAYYKKYYSTAHNKYESGVYYVGINNDIVAYSASGTYMSYGYGIDAAVKYGMDSVIKFKVLNDSGKVMIYELADRVMVDGKWLDAEKAGVENLEKNLFKYALADGKIKYIDTPEGATFENMYKESSYDSMNVADLHEASSGRYRSGGTGFEGSYYVNKAVVFVIDETDVEYGSKVGNNTYLESNEVYTGKIKFYDVDGVGMAGAVVTTKDFGEGVANLSGVAYVIQGVSQTIDNEGNECYKVKLMTHQGQHKIYYMDYDVMPKKSSGKILGFGDVIKMAVDINDTKILKVATMFDGENMRIENANMFKETSYTNNNFRYGMVYDYNNNQISYSNTTNFDESFVFDFSSIKFRSVNSANILVVDREGKLVRKGYQDDIKAYKDYKDDASKVIVMCNYNACSGVIVYEN